MSTRDYADVLRVMKEQSYSTECMTIFAFMGLYFTLHLCSSSSSYQHCFSHNFIGFDWEIESGIVRQTSSRRERPNNPVRLTLRIFDQICSTVLDISGDH